MKINILSYKTILFLDIKNLLSSFITLQSGCHTEKVSVNTGFIPIMLRDKIS